MLRYGEGNNKQTTGIWEAVASDIRRPPKRVMSSKPREEVCWQGACNPRTENQQTNLATWRILLMLTRVTQEFGRSKSLM